jgi:DNA-binding NtrC family response regulator
MVLIFTDNEQLDRDLSKQIQDSRIVYYPDYVLEEQQATTLIATIQPNKYNFKDFMFKVREKNIQVILILENDKVKELKDALTLGIYDIILDPFDLEDVCKKIINPTPFSEISKYIKDILEPETT